MSNELKGLKLEEHNGVGDNLTADVDYGGMIAIEIEEPWAGDTETGFGRSGSIRLNKAQAIELAEWLLKAATQGAPE